MVSRIQTILKTCIRLIPAIMIATVFTSMNSYGSNANQENDLQKNKECLRKEKEKCLGYRLPYKGHSVDDYVKDMEQRFSAKEMREVGDFLRKCEEQGLNHIIDIINSNKKDYKNPFRQIRIYTYALLFMLQLSKESLKEYVGLDEAKLDRMAHDFYSMAYRIPLEKTPDFKKLTNNKSVVIGRVEESIDTRMEKRPGAAADEGLHIIGGTVTLLNFFYDFYHQWTSLETTDWILRNVPKITSDNVLELGAGNGYQAHLLSLRRVNILATDSNPAYPGYKHVEKISALDAIKKYPKRNVYLLQYFPVIPRKQIIDLLIELTKRTQGMWTLVFISSRQPGTEVSFGLDERYFKEDVYTHKNALIESVRDYGDIGSENILVVLSKKKENVFPSSNAHSEL